MVNRTGGFRFKTRNKLKKSIKEKGKISLTKYFQILKTGDKVCLSAEPSYQKGMFFPRYQGRMGTITGKRGNCYEVEVYDRTKKKLFIVHPIHLKKL
ncbi:MAG: 50S ribosomal protein L21e [Candidatus Nanoarchaeia archaeon]|nr:50S ribosomal protein L21e [Candidatus Nanoarchaeia archaeon]MDD5588172.1 50S ribosomal protein L21e [Candidatus Nanoarchaeia archaeon]